MHKKPLVAVLIFGLLLLASSVGFAKTAPYNLTDDATLLPYIARGIVKDAPTAPTTLSGPTTNIQAGVSRTGATFCDGEWQTGGASYYSNWYYGDEFYASYQDPANLGTCTGLPDVYTFDVYGINWYIGELVGGSSYDMQPLVYENGGDAVCPLPGAVLCAGPLYLVTLPSAGFYILNLPFPDPCCSYNDYFAGVYSGPYVGPGQLGIVIDDGSAGVENCRCYNDYGGGWRDLGPNDIDFAGNLELWSEGATYDQNSCPGLPGDCAWVDYYGDISYYSSNPGGNIYQERFTRFNPDVECTLVATAFMIYAGGSSGTPTARFAVYGNAGPIFGGRMYPGQDACEPWTCTDANQIFAIDVLWGDITTYPSFHVIDWSVEDPNWPVGYVYTTGENYFVTEGLSPNTPNPATDVLATMLDGQQGAGHSGGYFGVASLYLYYDEAFGYDYGNVMENYVCCQHVELVEVECSNPGPDSWPTWGHDYERTCATSINVLDPCQITAVWTQPMTGGLNSFNEPTIADGRVYSNTDDRLWSFDLTTGAPGNTVSGLPHIFSSNRGNTTIDGGFAYVTGGNAQAIGQWTADLSVNNWVNGIGVGATPLGGQCRFGVTAVYDIAGTEVVVVGTETEPGRLWCFETATGAIYPGWGTNPVMLTEGVWHAVVYDGDDLYVGTAAPGSRDAGEVYRIDAATGAIVWTFTPANPADGFSGGISSDGGYIYTCATGASGSRAKINKGTGVADWEFGNTDAVYGVPAVGRNFVYIPQVPGVIVVDKGTGGALYNFANDGVGIVSQPVTITCDNYLFAGDQSGYWWLLDVNGQEAVFNVPFNGIVNGTSIANDGVDDFAVVSIRSGNDVDGGGYIAAFKFNAGVRPRVVQAIEEIDIPVPFGTGPGQAHNEADLLANDGCADLTISAANIYELAPDVVAKKFHDTQSRFAAAAANSIVGADYTAYFDNSTKGARLANRPLEFVDNELTQGAVAMENLSKAMVDSKRSSSRMAAGAQFLRTSGVTYTTPLAAGSSTDVDWLYDGTNLKRGIDLEAIEFVTNDPDRILFNSQPVLYVTYIGGCLDDELHFVWNTDGNANEQGFYNYGKLSDYPINQVPHIFVWGNDPEDGGQTFYEGSFFMAGTQTSADSPLSDADSSQFYIANMYDQWDAGGFAGNPKPGTDICGFDEDADVHLGYKRTGGCPGIPAEILGGWARSYYVDTINYFGDTPYGAIGTEITLTEVGAYDPDFGDFKLYKWDITERNGVAQGPIYCGTWTDWDVPPDGGSNHGIVSDNFNGYALWDWVTPSYAFGWFDPRMSTDYCGLNTSDYSPHRIEEMGTRADGGSGNDGHGGYGLWQGSAAASFEAQSLLWENVVNGGARVQSSADNHQNITEDGNYWSEDHFGLLVNKPFDFAGNDTKTIVQAEYGVNVSDVGSEGATNVALADARVTELARRAAIWGGFARGDANMDGCVNLIDVCWIGSSNQIYPDTYNGDVNLSGGVDAADASYLLDYVTGLGPAPQGEWRFTF